MNFFGAKKITKPAYDLDRAKSVIDNVEKAMATNEERCVKGAISARPLRPPWSPLGRGRARGAARTGRTRGPNGVAPFVLFRVRGRAGSSTWTPSRRNRR